jgi:DNA-binding PadR family transcriptional regulator
MATGAVSFRYFILGMLNRQPMSGYDIKRFISSLSWLIGSPSSGSLYPALRRLLQDGLATVEVIPSENRPPRKVYSITEAGRLALREWTDQPVTAKTPLRAFLMRLILAGNFSPSRLIGQLEQRRAQVAVHQAALEQMDQDSALGADLGQRLALRYSLAIATAELDCLSSMLRNLLNEPLPEEVVESERVTDMV